MNVRCRICGDEFHARRKQVLCSKVSCRAENMRRWQHTHGFISMRQNDRKPSNKRGECPCGAVFNKTNGNKKYCERCRRLSIQESKRNGSARRRAMTQKIAPQGSPTCETCGPLQALRFGSDPRDGHTISWCPKCGERDLVRIRRGVA